MTDSVAQLRTHVAAAVASLYDLQLDPMQIKIDKTPPEFNGEFTVVIFPFVKASRKSPEATGTEIGEALKARMSEIASCNVVKGFLNISLQDSAWLKTLNEMLQEPAYGQLPPTGKKVVIEYCGPNTNKPLHLGHVRNVLLGYSTANILAAAGNTVHKVNILNDRGIAICKSMVAYMRNGKGSTPASTGIKGDHFVGKYYVEYSRIFDMEVEQLVSTGMPREQAEKQAPIYKEASDLLLRWEAGDAEALALWNTMNDWVYAGFSQTYLKIGIDFEREYKESEFYLKGRTLVLDGLEKGIFYKKEDGSVWVDLTSDGLDEKVLLRADGTSVYITQDIGVAHQRYMDYTMDTSIYVVANEQDYHFKVLKLVMQKLGEPFADGIHHMSYGMVDLPEGKMKSREGTVVDADELIDGMEAEAEKFLAESDKSASFSADEMVRLAHQIGLSALKFFILKVDPKKRILFNPKESIDLHGHTGPFVQYTYARIRSVFRKVGMQDPGRSVPNTELSAAERDLIVLLAQYPHIVQIAAETYSPAEIANYSYHLAKKFNSFYADHSIANAETSEKRDLRLAIANRTAHVLKHALQLLGIESPERM